MGAGQALAAAAPACDELAEGREDRSRSFPSRDTEPTGGVHDPAVASSWSLPMDCGDPGSSLATFPRKTCPPPWYNPHVNRQASTGSGGDDSKPRRSSIKRADTPAGGLYLAEQRDTAMKAGSAGLGVLDEDCSDSPSPVSTVSDAPSHELSKGFLCAVRAVGAVFRRCVLWAAALACSCLPGCGLFCCWTAKQASVEELVELGLAVCSASALDCTRFVETAKPQVRAALHVLVQSARQTGFIKGSTKLTSTFLQESPHAAAAAATAQGRPSQEAPSRPSQGSQGTQGTASRPSQGSQSYDADDSESEGSETGEVRRVTFGSGGSGDSPPPPPVVVKSALRAPREAREGQQATQPKSVLQRQNTAQSLHSIQSRISFAQKENNGSKSSVGSKSSTISKASLALKKLAFREKRSRSQRSIMSAISGRSAISGKSSAAGCTDITETSFTDFNNRVMSERHSEEPAPSFLEFLVANRSLLKKNAGDTTELSMINELSSGAASSDFTLFPSREARPRNGGIPLVVEFDLPTPGPEDGGAPRVSLKMPNQDGSVVGREESESGQTYYSACDAVLVSEGGQKETVRAEVVNLSQGEEGLSKVRIEFQSQCLRTQNAWQRQLLMQQKVLLETFSAKLAKAEQKQGVMDEVRDEQMTILRNFRKIVTREVRDDWEMQRVQVFAIEKNNEKRAELQELCEILGLPCQAFKSFTQANNAIQEPFLCTASTNLASHSNLIRSMTTKSTISLASRQSSTSRYSGTSSASGDEDLTTVVVLLGASHLAREIPADWREREIYVALTSEAEEFEDVGRSLLAAGEAEIRERLRARGISDYLMHPMTLDSIRSVVADAVRRRFGHDYLLTDTVGRGSFGVVYRAKRLRDGNIFALKEINTQRLNRKVRTDVEREIELLRALEWPTIVSLVDAWETKDMRYLLMPLMDGGCISERLQDATRENAPEISVELVFTWYAQTLHGLSYLHWSGMLHRDIKPANLFLASDDWALQIGDLGSAARLPGPGPHPVRRTCIRAEPCTPLYASPEALLERTYYPSSDVWSVGASFYEILTLQSLMPTGTPLATIPLVVEAFDPSDSPGRTSAASESQIWNIAPDCFATLDRRVELADPADQQMADLARAIRETLQKDPSVRPPVADLAGWPSVLEHIRELFQDVTGTEVSGQEEHFEMFQRLLAESELAADMEPVTEPVIERDRRRRNSRERFALSPRKRA